jgi:2-(1,2-epoxy-1,2-dihydrophenyl)acetyl-CoA isomerase
LFLLGDRFTAHEAEQIGLVHAVLPDAALAARVEEVAAQLAAVSPAAFEAMKANLNDAETLPLTAYLDRETERFVAVSGSEDSKEAARAFLEKRPPVFKKH